MKRILPMLLAILLVFKGLGITKTSAAGFTDVIGYKEEITYLVNRDIIRGYYDGTFRPENNLTRLQAVTMILRQKGITDFTAPNPNFTDLKPGDYGYDIVAKAVSLGIISGKTASNGSKYFDPGASLTRGQMAKILSEGYGLKKTKDVSFKDVPSTSSYKEYVSILASQNITTGYDDGTFRPSVTLSRQHFAVFMARLLDNKFKPIIPNPDPEKPEHGKPNIPHPDDIKLPIGWDKTKQERLVKELQEKNGHNVIGSETSEGYFTLNPRSYGYEGKQDFKEYLEMRASWFGISYEQFISIINHVINTGEVYDAGSLIVYYDYLSESYGFLTYSYKKY